MAKIEAFPCKLNGRHLDWDYIPTEYLPNTIFPWVDYYSERCMVCGVVVCRMVTALGNTRSFYQASSYPEGYKATLEEMQAEMPSGLERFRMRKERGEKKYNEREQRAASRRRKKPQLQEVA